MIRFALAVLVVSIFAQPASAETRAVYVQCKLDGPVYEGTLSFNYDVSTWEKGECVGSSFPALRVIIPGFELKFNGLVYSLPAGRTQESQLHFRDNGCTRFEKAQGEFGFEAEETRSKFTVNVRMPYTMPLTASLHFSFYDQQYCFVSPR